MPRAVRRPGGQPAFRHRRLHLPASSVGLRRRHRRGVIGAAVNIFWIFSYPLASILLITLNLIVVYALTTYGVDEM